MSDERNPAGLIQGFLGSLRNSGEAAFEELVPQRIGDVHGLSAQRDRPAPA